MLMGYRQSCLLVEIIKELLEELYHLQHWKIEKVQGLHEEMQGEPGQVMYQSYSFLKI